MEEEMREQLTLSLTRTANERANTEESASTGTLVIKANGRSMTEGIDTRENEVCDGPDVAGYYLAEWFVWNWWRLRWEPPVATVGTRNIPNSIPAERIRSWDFAHSLSTIGHGFDWPNITISSDGFMTAVTCGPSAEPDAVSYRYVTREATEVVSAESLEHAIDTFVDGVFQLLTNAKLRESNLHALWDDLQAERADETTAYFRRLEARLGFDPDEIDEDLIKSYIDDAQAIGEGALEEIAAHSSQSGAEVHMIRAAELKDIAQREGFKSSGKDAIQLSPEAQSHVPRLGEVPAWQVGKAAADQLRAQENLGLDPVPNKRLADLAGTQSRAITNTDKHFKEFSFVINSDAKAAHVALRSKWETGRRFDLARLIGDRLFPTGESLCPATRTHSYRQKVQRAFAAHFLCPVQAIDAMLSDDDSEDGKQDIANHFLVSEKTVDNLVGANIMAW
jgi:hypothetical protein